ncbi:hypothetical protein HKD37_14G040143 [Glycine soja]
MTKSAKLEGAYPTIFHSRILQRSTRDVPSLILFETLVDVPSTRTDPQEIQTQVDVPSTCTTKDVPSNVFRQRSQAMKPLILCEWGYKRILRREWEESKEFSDGVILNYLTREKGDTKEFRRLVLGEFFLAKGEEKEKMNSIKRKRNKRKLTKEEVIILHEIIRPNSLKTVPSEVANCRNLPFGGRATQDSRVRLPRKENARSRHQCLFEENVRKTGKRRGLRTLNPQRMYPPLFSLNNLVDVPSTRTDPQEMYPLLFSVTTTQVDVPSTCTTKDVPSNGLRQSSQAVSPSKLCEWGNKRILRQEESKEFSDCVVLNSLTREKGDIKEFRWLVFRSFGKGRRDTQKEFRRLVLGEFFLTKGEGNEKDE